jgi:hypothetical protein
MRSGNDGTYHFSRCKCLRGGTSLDPKLNDIRHLRAEQAKDGAVVIILGVHEITQIVRILQPPPVWIVDRQAHSKPKYFGDPARLEKRLELGSATRNATPHSAMHRASMGASDGQSNWPNMRKPQEKSEFLSGENRNRTFWCIPNVFEEF